MSFWNFILDNCVIIFELIGLLIILFISAHISTRMKRYTRVTIILLFLVALASSYEIWTQSFDTLSMWRPFLTATKYTLYPLILVFIMFVFSSITGKTSWKWKVAILGPMIIAIPLYYTSQWSELIFYFTEDNVYHGGALQYLPYVIFVTYSLILMTENIIYLKNYSFREKIIMLYIVIASMVCVAFYLIFDYSDNYSLIFTSSLVFYFLFLYIHLSNSDPLTKLLNRQSYYQDIEILGDRVDAVVSIDMNELKYYNDVFGHDRGDEALKDVARILYENSTSKNVYRVGGDEFAIFYKNANEEMVINEINLIREKFKETPYSCAFGYCMKLGRLEDMIKIADYNMFTDKKSIKDKIIKEGGEVHKREE